MLILKEIITPVGAGVTIPCQVLLSDNKHYIAKFPGNPEKLYPLIFESMCHDLSLYFDLPVQEKRYVNINFSHDIKNIELLPMNIAKDNGVAFAVLFNRNVVPVNDFRLILNSKNKIYYLVMLIFDMIILNNDRNKGNLLFDYKYNKLIIIDHTHIITGPLFPLLNEQDKRRFLNKTFSVDDIHPYSLNLFENLKANGSINEFLKSDESTILLDFIVKVKETSQDKLYEILKKTQIIWNIPENDVLFICEFLYERMNRIDDILNLLGIII